MIRLGRVYMRENEGELDYICRLISESGEYNYSED